MKLKIFIITLIIFVVLCLNIFAQRGTDVAPATTPAPIATIPAPATTPAPIATIPDPQATDTPAEGGIKTLSDFGNTESTPKTETLGSNTSSIKTESFLFIEKNNFPDRKSFSLKSDKDAVLDSEIQRVTNLMLGQPQTTTPTDATVETEKKEPLYDYSPSGEQNVPDVLRADTKASASWIVFWSQVDIWESFVKSRLIQPGVVEKSYVDLWKGYAAQSDPTLPQSEVSASALKNLNWQVLSAIMIPESTKVQEDLDGLYDEMLKIRDVVVDQRNKDNFAFVANLENRESNRLAFEEWINDRRRDINIYAEDYIEKESGSEVTIDDTVFLISNKPLESVPLNAVNIVTDNITPFDIFKSDGTLKEPIPID